MTLVLFGAYRVGVEIGVDLFVRIGRADVADFMLKQVIA